MFLNLFVGKRHETMLAHMGKKVFASFFKKKRSLALYQAL
jgi:hypothetical protein